MSSPNPKEPCVVAGVDGCRAGWLTATVAWREDHAEILDIWVAGDLGEAATRHGPRQVAVDIPIGLLDERRPGGRDCDRLARRALPGRASSVFTPPPRPALQARDYAQAKPYGLTIQAFHITPKIAQVDAWITPERQRTIFEAHPELAFCALAGRPMSCPKRKPAGIAERLAALATVYRGLASRLADFPIPAKSAAKDDTLDACALAWVAVRRIRGEAVCLPPDPPRDSRGLEMAIWG